MNSAEGPDWKLWEQPDTHRSRGRVSFQAAIAAKRQGEDAFDAFHHDLLLAKHAEGKDHGRASTLRAVAEGAGLEPERFERDRTDRSLLSRIGEDYEEAREVHGIFGTPTFVFPDGSASYLKLQMPIPRDDAVPFFEQFTALVDGRSYVTEIKRPVKPEPN